MLPDTYLYKSIKESCSSILVLKQRKSVLQNKDKGCLIHIQVGIATKSPGKDIKATVAISLHLECSIPKKQSEHSQTAHVHALESFMEGKDFKNLDELIFQEVIHSR